jgi:rhodanese-related sulfurtransferase
MKRWTIISVLLIGLSAACGGAPAPAGGAADSAASGATLFANFTAVETESGKFYQIDSPALAEGLKNKNFTFVNVHIPYEGEIEQTDAFIAYDQISFHLDELPQDKNAPIVLYCRSGRMSGIAATELANMGYTNVWDLAGGMVAWKAAGFELIQK